MELIDKYIYEVYTARSFSAASKNLFISQPSLSASVSRQEKTLGFKIFDRSVIPLTLTPRGKIYISYLEEIMTSEENMKQRIQALSNTAFGNLSIGAYSSSTYLILPKILGAFYKRYPGVHVHADMGNLGTSTNVYEKLKKHTLDVVLSYKYVKKDHVAIPLIKEKMIIAMQREMAEAAGIADLSISREELLSGNYPNEKEISDITVFKDIKFFTHTTPNSITGRKMDEILGNFKVADYTVSNVRHATMHYKLMCEGIGAVMMSDFHALEANLAGYDICYFIPRHESADRTIYFVREKGHCDNQTVDAFISIAKEIYPEENFLQLKNKYIG